MKWSDFLPRFSNKERITDFFVREREEKLIRNDPDKSEFFDR